MSVDFSFAFIFPIIASMIFGPFVHNLICFSNLKSWYAWEISFEMIL